MRTRQSRGLGLVALLGAALVSLPGCLEDDARTTLRRDGSGTYEQVSIVHMAKARAAMEMLAAESRELEPAGAPSDADPFGILGAERLASTIEDHPGIRRCSSHVEADADTARHTMRRTVEFTTFKALFESGAVEDVDVTLEKTDEGTWKLSIRPSALAADPVHEDEPAAKALRALRRRLLERFKPYWGDLRIVSRLTLPTKVLATNGTKDPAGRLVTWRFGFADLADPGRWVREVTFADAEDLELEAFSHEAQEPRRTAPEKDPEENAEGTTEGK